MHKKKKNTGNTFTHCRSVLLSMLNKLRVQSRSRDELQAGRGWHLLRVIVSEGEG